MTSGPSVRPGPSLYLGIAAALGLLALGVTLFGSIIVEKGPGGSWWPDSDILGVLGFTLFQAGLSTLLSLGAGCLLAWSLFHRRSFPGRSYFIAILPIGMVLPTLVVVLGLVTVFGRNGWINNGAELVFGAPIGNGIYGLSGILLAHCYLNGTFVARAFLHQLEAIPAERWKLGRSLGLTPWRRFLTIEWPSIAASAPGLGATVFLLCFTSFAIVLTLGGSPKFNTLEVSIYEAVRLDFDLSRAVTLSLVQMLVCASLVLLMSNLRGTASSAIQVTRMPDWPISRPLFLIQCLVIIGFAAVFLGPLLAVIIDGVTSELGGLLIQDAFQSALLSSLLIAFASSVVTLALAITLSGAKCWIILPTRSAATVHSRLTGALLQFSGSLYLTVPSLVLGLGFFLFTRNTGADTALMAPMAVVTANVLMALPIALAVLVPAFQQTGYRYDRLCFSLGIQGFSRWMRIEYPALRREMGFVCALSFCFSFGDLGVIALFGNDRFSTLPWFLYQKMGAYRTTEAASIALVMLVLTILTFLLVPRLFEGRHRA